jgi:hypothetical protein
MPDRTVEVDRPQGRAVAGRRVADDERRMTELEFEVDRTRLRAADDKPRLELDCHVHRLAAARALGALNLDLIRRNRRLRWCCEPGRRIGGRRQRHVAGIGGQRQRRPGVGTGASRGAGQELADVVERGDARHRYRRRRRVDRRGAAATLRRQCDRHDRNADHRPVLGRRVADNQRRSDQLRRDDGRRRARASAAAAGGEAGEQYGADGTRPILRLRDVSPVGRWRRRKFQLLREAHGPPKR